MRGVWIGLSICLVAVSSMPSTLRARLELPFPRDRLEIPLQAEPGVDLILEDARIVISSEGRRSFSFRASVAADGEESWLFLADPVMQTYRTVWLDSRGFPAVWASWNDRARERERVGTLPGAIGWDRLPSFLCNRGFGIPREGMPALVPPDWQQGLVWAEGRSAEESDEPPAAISDCNTETEVLLQTLDQFLFTLAGTYWRVSNNFDSSVREADKGFCWATNSGPDGRSWFVRHCGTQAAPLPAEGFVGGWVGHYIGEGPEKEEIAEIYHSLRLGGNAFGQGRLRATFTMGDRAAPRRLFLGIVHFAPQPCR